MVDFRAVLDEVRQLPRDALRLALGRARSRRRAALLRSCLLLLAGGGRRVVGRVIILAEAEEAQRQAHGLADRAEEAGCEAGVRRRLGLWRERCGVGAAGEVQCSHMHAMACRRDGDGGSQEGGE